MTNTSIVQQDAVIVSLQRASSALAEAKTIQQTKKILDVAAAAEIYAKRQHLGEEAEKIALSIKVEALRKMGEILLATPKAKGARAVGGDSRSGGSISVPPENDAPTLAELGLDKKESAVAQKLASLSEEAFEQVREGHVTVSKALAAVDASKKKTSKATTTAAASTPEQREPGPVRSSTEAPDDDGAPSAEEMAEAERAAADDAAVVRLLLESDDKLAAVTEKCKQQAALIRTLESRIQGLTNEAAQAIRLAKSWRQKYEKLEKAAA